MCRASRLLRATVPIALSPAHVRGLVKEQGRSTLRCRRKPPHFAVSRLVMNAIVFDRGALWFSVPEGNRPCGSRLEHHLADCLADQLGVAAAVLHDQAGIGGWWSLAQPLRTLR